MSRIQRLGIGNGGVDCAISYMQGKKYPNAGEIVKPVQGVTNNTLLKNPYNNLSVSVPKPGERPLRITTDNRGNVFARSETMLVPGVTNDTLLKNPHNIRSVAASEKRTLTLQRIKDINNRTLPSYITENKGINEVMLQILTMIEDKPVKLITIQLLKILITKNVSALQDKNQQKMLDALNAFDSCLTEGRQIFRENTLSPTSIPERIRPAVDRYVARIKQIYGNLAATPQIDTDIQTGLSELGLLSNALTRMFEYNNAIDPSNTLTRDQINAAAYSGWGNGPVGPGQQPVGPGQQPIGPGQQPVLPNQAFQSPIADDNLQVIYDSLLTKIDEDEIKLRDLVNNLTRPVFDKLKDQLLKINTFFQDMRQALIDAKDDKDLLTDFVQNYNAVLTSQKYNDVLWEMLNSQESPQQQAGPGSASIVPGSASPGPVPANPFIKQNIIDDLKNNEAIITYLIGPKNTTAPLLKNLFITLQRISTSNSSMQDPLNERRLDLIKTLLSDNNFKAEFAELNVRATSDPDVLRLKRYIDKLSSFFFLNQPAMPGKGRTSRHPQNNKVVFQVGKATQYRKY
jgi:hypothetical protein